MGNVCSCLRGSGSYSPNSGNSGKVAKSSEVEQNGSPEDTVEKNSEELTKRGEDVRKPSATEVELEIVPSASGAQENIKSEPSTNAAIPPLPEDKNEPKLAEGTSEVSSKDSKSVEINEDTAVASSSSMKPDNEVSKSTELSGIQVDVMEAKSGEKISVADEKEIGADNTEKPSKDAEEIGLKDGAVEKSSTSTTIGEKNTENATSPEIEEVVASIEREQGDLEEAAQSVPIDHEKQTETSSKSDVEVVQEEIGLKPEMLEQNKELESELPMGIPIPAQNASNELLAANKPSDISHEDVSATSGLPETKEVKVENEVLAEKLEETASDYQNTEQETTSAELNKDDVAVSPPETKETASMNEDNEHIESSQPVQSLNVEAANGSKTEVVESVFDPLPTDDTFQQAENSVPEAPSEVPQSNDNVPSNTPIDAAFLPLEATKDGGESTLLNELGLVDHQPKSSSLDEVQKYVEEMVNGSVAVVEGEIQKENEVKPTDEELSASHSEDLHEKVNALDQDAAIQVVEDIENAELVTIEEATVVHENQAQESVPPELRANDVETIVKDDEPAELQEEASKEASVELQQPASSTTAGIEGDVLSKALPSEDITTDTLQHDLDDNIPVQLTTASEQTGEDSMVDSVLSLLQEKFSSSTSQEVKTED